MHEQHHLRQFLLFVFALLIPCFGLWTLVSSPLALPAIGFVNMILSSWFPDVVAAFYAQGPEGLLLTEFGELNGKPVAPGLSEYQLGFTVDTRILSYSIPFYSALHFATQKKDYLGGYFLGLLILYLLLVFGLLCLCMKELMIILGPLFLQQEDVLVPHANVIGLLYQLNVLILPTLAPTAIWAWQSRESPLLVTILGKAVASQSGKHT